MASQTQHVSTVDLPVSAPANASYSSCNGNSHPDHSSRGTLVGHLDGTYSYMDAGSVPGSQNDLDGPGLKKEAKPRKKTALSLTYGMIRFKWVTPASPEDESSNQVATPEAKPKKRLPVFDLVNRHMAKPIQLYSNQMLRLIEELPNAYEAFYQADVGYRFDLIRTQDQLVVLEISLYNNKTYLFLKKYFKPEEAKSSGDAWVPTRSMLSFDPDLDDTDKMLDFYADCCQ